MPPTRIKSFEEHCKEMPRKYEMSTVAADVAGLGRDKLTRLLAEALEDCYRRSTYIEYLESLL